MQPDYNASLEFLKRWLNTGPWILTAISLDKKSIETRTFRDEDKAKEWLNQHGNDRNIYFHVNPAQTDLNKKADREDVASLAWLHVDLDPRAGEDIEAERKRALEKLQQPPEGIPAPTAIIFSGGGYQGFWRLQEPMQINGREDLYEEAKRYNQQIELLFGADNCHNVDRIMRLPGTINRPDARKKKKGRTEQLAELVEFHDDRVFDLNTFTPAPRVQGRGESGFGGGTGEGKIRVSGNVSRINDVNDLPDEVGNLCKIVIVQGYDPDKPDRFPSRSEAVFYVCNQMVRGGCDDDTIYAVITDPEFHISDSILEKGSGADGYAVRQIERAREDAIDPMLREMNEKHAVIDDIGGKCRVISEVWDYAMDRQKISCQSFEDISNRYRNKKVAAGQDKQGNPTYQPLGKWWLDHPNRRQYASMTFLPGREVPNTYNMWRGFACDAIPGNCQKYLDHLYTNICNSVDEYYNYLIGWMARAVQKPDSPGQTAVVLRGRRGTGKSFFVKMFGSIFGRHYLQVSDSKHLVGSFNAHLRDCVVLFGDEAFAPNDKKHESVLKTLITEDTLAIESKGVDIEASRNCIHLIMASNEHWVVPAGLEERRFFALQIAEHHIQDNSYFKEIADEMDNGGREALLHMLINYDLSNFDVRNPPKTSALLDQKESSMNSEEDWWVNKLRDGKLLPEHGEWQQHIFCEELLEDYIAYTRKYNVAKRSNATRLGHFLRRCCPEGQLERWQSRETVTIRKADGSEQTIRRPYYYLFPDLQTLRDHWDENFGGPYEWEPIPEPEGGGDQQPF